MPEHLTKVAELPSKRPVSIGTFLWSFSETWGSRVSGGLSVPLTAAAFFVPSAWAKVSFASLAAVCFVIASYQVWAKEKRRADGAEQQNAPQLEITYDYANCLITAEHETYRLKIQNTGIRAVDDVEVRVVASSTLAYLSGYLPMILREQHYVTGPPFTLKGDSPRYFDFVEYSER